MVLNDGNKVALKFKQSHGRQSRAVNTRVTVLMASPVISCHCPFLFRYLTAYVGRASGMTGHFSAITCADDGRVAAHRPRSCAATTNRLPVVQTRFSKLPTEGASLESQAAFLKKLAAIFLFTEFASVFVDHRRSFLCFKFDVAFTKESRKKCLV